MEKKYVYIGKNLPHTLLECEEIKCDTCFFEPEVVGTCMRRRNVYFLNFLETKCKLISIENNIALLKVVHSYSDNIEVGTCIKKNINFVYLEE